MNHFMQEKWPMWDGTHGMRTQLLDLMTDADLAFSPGGANLTLGALCREMGEVEYAYTQSLKTFRLDWNYHNTEPGLDRSVDRLKAWFAQLDAEMKAALDAMSDDDLKKDIVRASGYAAPADFQMDAYLQALLIFFGKATIFFKAMNKPLPQAFIDWIW